MGKTQLVQGFVAVLAVAVVAGCAGMGGPSGPSDQELIESMLAEFEAAFIANDIDQIMAHYSEDFDSPDQGDKQAIREFLGGAIDQGFLEDAEVDRTEAQITMGPAGNTAVVYPVEVAAAFGSATLELTVAKEADGVWRITDQVIEGI